jgi:hypothetical protein
MGGERMSNPTMLNRPQAEGWEDGKIILWLRGGGFQTMTLEEAREFLLELTAAIAAASEAK